MSRTMLSKVAGTAVWAAIALFAFGAAAEDKAAIQALYEKAKKEGEVIIWGPAALELQWIPAAFEQRFPGIEVKWNADRRAPTKIIAEARAGRTSLDVTINSLGGIEEIQKRKLLAKMNWSIFGLPKDAVYFGGEAGATHNPLYVVGFNIDHVKVADLPRKWEGFLDPKWKGKLMATPFLLPRLAGFLAMEWGEQRTATWLHKLIEDQELMITNAPQDSVLKSGERVVTITNFSGLLQAYAEEGIPVDWVSMDLIPAVQFVSAVMKDAPHPNAARLLAGFLTTPEAGVSREASSFEGSIRPGSKSKVAQKIRSLGGKVLLEDPGNAQERADFYKKLSPIVTGRKG